MPAKKTAKKPARKLAKQPAKKTVKRAQRTSARKVDRRPLTTKQEVFTEEYLANGFNAKDAARAAGYKGNDRTLEVVGSENLRKPEISSRVRARVEGLAATADEVLNVLADHLRADIGEFVDCFEEDGRLDLRQAQQRGLSRLVKKMKVRSTPVRGEDGEVYGREYTTEIELHDAQGAAGKLVAVLGLKQAAAENQADAARKREWAFTKLREVMERLNIPEEQARGWLREHVPAAAQYLM